MNDSMYILLKKRNGISLDAGKENHNPVLIATMMRNLQDLGYVPSRELFERMQTVELSRLTLTYNLLIKVLKQMKGAHVAYKPMYPNFPTQVMESSYFELYFNALVHYWSDGKLFPVYDKLDRGEVEEVKCQTLNLVDESEIYSVFKQILSSNTSISQDNKEILEFIVSSYDVENNLPDNIPQKEQVALIVALFIKNDLKLDVLQKYIKGANDVLRLAVTLCDGDVSLATPTKFKFNRANRRFLLGCLNNCSNIVEDMAKWRERWLRLGEALHPGEYQKAFPKAYDAFRVLRNSKSYDTFNSKIEYHIKKDMNNTVSLLKTRPGEFARRLDHILRTTTLRRRTNVIRAFSEVVDDISTPVLLQVYSHFSNRDLPYRTFLPKGNVAKFKVIDNNLESIGIKSNDVVNIVSAALLKRFSKLPSMGKVYIDPVLEDYIIPFSQRSASKSLKTLVRGSRIPLEDGNTVRFFIWWKNGSGRTDIDLSAVAYNKDYQYITDISYYNLKNELGCHSGDIVNAPNGASEFIDVNIEKAIQLGYRYIVMSIYSYTHQPYKDLPECFAGWMMRSKPKSGEIYEPKTVVNKVDLASDSKTVLPLVIDLVERKVIWMDLGISDARSYNNSYSNQLTISNAIKGFTNLAKPSLFDLARLHAEARGELVYSKEEADIVFSVNEGITPFDVDKIASELLV